MYDDDIAEELLLRDTAEITLVVDVQTARDMDDETLERVLGRAALLMVRESMEED